MGKGRIRVSFDWLREAMSLPDDTEIDTVVVGQEYGEIYLFVRHPDIPPIYGKGMILTVMPEFREEGSEQRPIVKFIGWQ